jgi:outer membrane protein assembly factor BamB
MKLARLLGAALALGLAGCTSTPAQPVGPARPAPSATKKPQWTLTVSTGSHRVTVVGDVAIVYGEKSVLAVDASTGAQRWHRDLSYEPDLWVGADNRLVLVDSKQSSAEVLDSATGATAWQLPASRWSPAVFTKTIYAGECGSGDTCTLVAHDLRDGHVLWRTPNIRYGLPDDRVGLRPPATTDPDAELVAGTGTDQKPWGTLDALTGKPTARARVDQPTAWYRFAFGPVLVSTDNDPPRGDSNCTVRVNAVNAHSGKQLYTGTVFSGRKEDGECAREIANRADGYAAIGTGGQIVVDDAHGRPQRFNLLTGSPVWIVDAPGVPLDGDVTGGVLVRRYADEGPLTLLDMRSGVARWTAPDPGLSGESASWASAVTGGLVAVSGATGEHPFVIVYRARDGKELGRFPSWLEGAGENWVAVQHGAGDPNQQQLEFYKV